MGSRPAIDPADQRNQIAETMLVELESDAGEVEMIVVSALGLCGLRTLN